LKKEAVNRFGNKCFFMNNYFLIIVITSLEDLKDYNPSYALVKFGFDRAKEELDKCVMLCSNCHRITLYGDKKMVKNMKGDC